ncbi:biopolymer transport protein ExbD [Hydrogenivirga caldilitoris]|uniref:Biopolymer transport protein ExbD n=1 Tax=Hydrogenivirga caldilitoris TaxID=246264 RepID=A0A497XPN8_9AQUI|nr:biopolymer transporter ExbD [Hydrogenivirga caldilitoris]RLJ70915.1 biopolymer transport protein ExbD [Hydrogenivirga caldilitoris]
MNLRKRARFGADERAYIDVVPLVDTLLAVFLFLAVLAFQSPLTFIAVKLPEAEKGETQRIRAARVQVTQKGALLLEGKPTDIKTIERFLSDKKPQYLIIEADEDTKHKFVVYVMDTAKKAGVENVIIAVRKKR